MKKARAMYIPAGGKQAVWGPIDQNVLPEGYPYKEQSETALFEKQTLAFRSMNGFGIAQTTAIPAEAGKEYIVSFDGEIYRCAAFMAAGMSGGETPTVGNAGQLGGEDTGEPFLIAFANNKTEVYCFVAGETHELQISVMSETIHQMAPEFLPAGVGGINLTNAATVGQTIKVSAVDENGVPTAWEAVDMASSTTEQPLLILVEV